MNASLKPLTQSKDVQQYHVDDNLLKLLIKLFSKNLIHRKLLTYKETENHPRKMYGKSQSPSASGAVTRANSKSPHKKIPKLEHELMRVEYYNDFNSCLSLSQTISVLNSGNIDSARKLASSINSATAAAQLERNVVSCSGGKSQKREVTSDRCQHGSQFVLGAEASR